MQWTRPPAHAVQPVQMTPATAGRQAGAPPQAVIGAPRMPLQEQRRGDLDNTEQNSALAGCMQPSGCNFHHHQNSRFPRAQSILRATFATLRARGTGLQQWRRGEACEEHLAGAVHHQNHRACRDGWMQPLGWNGKSL